MTDDARSQMLFHGTIVLFGGMLTGLPLGVAIADGWGGATIHAWGVTHSSLVSAGMLLIVIGAAARYLVLPRRGSALLTGTLVPSTYALCIGLIVSAVSGQRGLEPIGPALNVILFAANVLGVLGAFIAGALLVRGAYGALRATAPSAVRHEAMIEAR